MMRLDDKRDILRQTGVSPLPLTGTQHPAASIGHAAHRRRFAINGRFIGQRMTGVQRYAREITRALDDQWAAAGERGQLVTTDTAPVEDLYAATDVSRIGPFDGHLWEQAVLPLRCGLPLLNLCNTAPVLRHRQVVCLHDANVFVEPGSYSVAFRTAYRLLLPQLARVALRVTSVSKSSASQLAAHLPIAAHRIEVLPNGHEHVFRWTPAASRLAGNLPTTRPFILLLGSRARHKNAALILRQADALDAVGLDLVVAGGGSGIFSPATAMARPNIRHLGVVSDDDLAVLYGAALCLAFPSLTEGFGLPIVEAMALGCPVVSSDRASMPEVCGDAALFAPPDDPHAWLSHFKRLAGSRAACDDLRGRGRQQVQKFSWRSSARGYLDLLDAFALTA